jgi:hypothetical protein
VRARAEGCGPSGLKPTGAAAECPQIVSTLERLQLLSWTCGGKEIRKVSDDFSFALSLEQSFERSAHF